MTKLWRRYKPFINAGVQELITYRVNFILYQALQKKSRTFWLQERQQAESTEETD